MQFPSSASAVCNLLLSKYNKIVFLIEEAIVAPLILLAQLTYIIKQLERLAEDYIDDNILGNLDDLNDYINSLPSLQAPAADFLNALEKCPYIRGLPANADALIAAINANPAMQASEMGKQLVNEITGEIKGGITEQIDEYMQDSLSGKMAFLAEKYEAMLEAAGVNDMLDELATIQQCLEGLCETVATVEDKVTAFKDKLKIDDKGELVMDRLKEDTSAFTDDVKSELTSRMDKAKNVKSAVNDKFPQLV